MKDVRMGRLKTPEGSNQGVECVEPGAQIIGPNPRRAGLIVSLLGSPAETSDYPVRILAGSLLGPTIGAISSANPSKLFRVEDYGRAILGPVFGIGHAGNEAILYTTELVWLDDPGDA